MPSMTVWSGPTHRLLWTVVVDGTTHRLTLVPSFFRPWADVLLDGTTVTRMRSPTRKDPWREATIDVAGATVTIALIHNWLGTRTDVFLNGRSLTDGRTPEAVRADGPAPVGAYERWFGEFVANRWRPTFGEVAYVFGVCGALNAVSMTLLVFTGVAVGRAVALGVLLTIGYATILLVTAAWGGLVARLNVRLLARPDLGTARRALIFFAALTVPPALACVLVFVVAYALVPR